MIRQLKVTHVNGCSEKDLSELREKVEGVNGGLEARPYQESASPWYRKQ